MLSLRLHIGLTQARLAEKLHVSRHTVVEWENGRSYPNAEANNYSVYANVPDYALYASAGIRGIRGAFQP
ncbi:helix-turn-helix transcriptional regulator [Dictyobacter aurantiacus]|uniref:helix-turn-helix transcriptional regulator n=1 Tax=Dictyobacter aurantiacus TaxID=1936993 RepID=UPI000F839B60